MKCITCKKRPADEINGQCSECVMLCDTCEGTGVFGMYLQADLSGVFAQVSGVNDLEWPDGWLAIERCGSCERFATNDDAAAFWFERWEQRCDECGCDECEAAPDDDSRPHGRWELAVDPKSRRNHALDEVPPEHAKYTFPTPTIEDHPPAVVFPPCGGCGGEIADPWGDCACEQTCSCAMFCSEACYHAVDHPVPAAACGHVGSVIPSAMESGATWCRACGERWPYVG